MHPRVVVPVLGTLWDLCLSVRVLCAVCGPVIQTTSYVLRPVKSHSLAPRIAPS